MHRRTVLRTLATGVLAACLALAPLPAIAGVAPSAKRTPVRLTAQQLRAKGPDAVRALEMPEELAEGHITGRVGHEGGMFEDSMLAAVVFTEGTDEYDEPGWYAIDISEVATDGTYAMAVPFTGDYRVGVMDWANVYADGYYDGASTVESATTIAVSVDTTVAGIDVTVTPLPENIISGTVAFSGAEPPSGDVAREEYVEVSALQYASEDDYGYWWSRTYGLVRPDGSYRLHLPNPGSYRVGFWDNSGAFGEVFYHDATSAEEATDVVVPSPAESKSGIDQTMTAIPSKRVSGDDRYETAAAISQSGFSDDEAMSVILATGENWPDAISGSVLASRSWGPLLLTKKGYLPEVTADEIRRLHPFEVIIIGDTNSVSLDVEIALRTEFDVERVWRLAGRDRYETAALVAEETMGDPMFSVAGRRPLESMPDTPPLVVASGEKFPDAMSAAPLAANAYAPVLLVKRDSVPPSVQAFLDRHEGDFDSSLVIGGAASVSTETADAFPMWDRIAGADRYETAAEVGRHGVTHFEMDPTAVGIASGISFSDGLAAVPVLALRGEPLLLTHPMALSPAAEEFMVDHGTSRAIVFGGEPSVSSDTFEEILEVLGR